MTQLAEHYKNVLERLKDKEQPISLELLERELSIEMGISRRTKLDEHVENLERQGLIRMNNTTDDAGIVKFRFEIMAVEP